MDKTGGQGGTTENHRHLDTDLIEGLEVVLHEGGGFNQQATHGNAVGLMLLLGFDDGLDILFDAEIDDLIAIVCQDNIDKVLADVMHIPLHCGDQEFTLATRCSHAIGSDLFVHVRLQKSHR